MIQTITIDIAYNSNNNYVNHWTWSWVGMSATWNDRYKSWLSSSCFHSYAVTHWRP